VLRGDGASAEGGREAASRKEDRRDDDTVRDELRALRARVETAVYSSERREVALRADGLDGALALADAIVAARRDG